MIAYLLVVDGCELFFGRNNHPQIKSFPFQNTLLQNLNLKKLSIPCMACKCKYLANQNMHFAVKCLYTVLLFVNCFQENSFLFILDELLLDILKGSGKQSMRIKKMEKLILKRTGRSFSTLHDIVKQTEYGSHGIEDFIDNDSKIFHVDNLFVRAGLTISPHDVQHRDLDLSNTRITSCRDLVTKCLQARNASTAVLRRSTISDDTEWRFGVLDILCWFCPELRHVDLTGCVDLLGNNISNISNYQSKVQVIDYLDPSFILNCTDAVAKIREILASNSISPYTNIHGWSPLHSATLLGDKEMVKQLLEYKETGDDNNIYSDFLQTSLELAIVLHHIEIVQLFRRESNLFKSPSRLVQLLILPKSGLKNFDHPVEALTSNKDVLQKVRNSHKAQACNLMALLRTFYENNDDVFKKELLEGLLQKLQECTERGVLLAFPCWDEKAICEAVQILMEETQCPANGKIDGYPYLMFSMPSIQMAKLLMQKGAQIDEKDQLGCTSLFHAVENALMSASPQNWNEFIDFLLCNANPNARNDLSETPLLFSLSSQFQSCEFCSNVMCHELLPSTTTLHNGTQAVDVWRRLLDAKARANAKDERDRSLLHLLFKFVKDGNFVQARKCLVMVCKGLHILRNGGFEINSRDTEGNTPLHLWASLRSEAVSAEAMEIGKQIISYGGAVNARNDKGKTPLHLARCRKQAAVLVKRGALLNVQDLNGDTPFHEFIGEGSVIGDDVEENFWKDLLASQLNPWCVSSDGKCPFEVLLVEEFFESAFNLLKAIFEDDTYRTLAESARCYKDLKGDSLLHILCILDNESVLLICEYLLQKGFEVDVQNECKETPLHMICRAAARSGSLTSKHIENCIRLLRRYHADVNLLDVNGDSCKVFLDGNEYLQNIIDEDIEKVNMPSKIKWSQQSVKHNAVLYQVVRGTKFRKVENYYHHENPIGEGSFAVVFPGVNGKDGREVALKRLEKARLKEKGVGFEREVKCLLKLSNCPMVVNYINCISDANFEYIVVELMEGSLDAYLRCDRECKEAFDICLNIASGIEFLHNSGGGVLHRDLKPQNILYNTKPSFCVKISDFGLSKILQTSHTRRESESVMHSKAGTRCWMAPELLGKKPQRHSKACDIFSCGLLFHYVLSKKKHPFSSISGGEFMKNPQQTENNILTNQIHLCPSLSPEASDLLENILSPEPKKRPAASSLVHFPFFWDDRKKVDFLKLVGSQPEFEKPRRKRTHPSSVEKKLDYFYSKKGVWLTDGWNTVVKEIYHDVTSGEFVRKDYDTTSAVELVRFIRNSYAHVYSLQFKRNKWLLLETFVFLKRFPFLVTETYKAVKESEEWRKRKDLKHFFR